MLRTRAVEVSLWEAVLPPEVLRLPEELARVDALLDDPAFFTPFVPFFDPRVGRPSTPMETYLRMMFLKFRYRLGYESLCSEVSDSITWRRFCRIPIDGKVSHPRGVNGGLAAACLVGVVGVDAGRRPAGTLVSSTGGLCRLVLGPHRPRSLPSRSHHPTGPRNRSSCCVLG